MTRRTSAKRWTAAMIIIYEPPQTQDQLDRIEHALCHIICLQHELLEELVQDPAKIQALSDKLKASAAALRSATKAAKP